MRRFSFSEVRYAWPRGQDVVPQITAHGAMWDDAGGDRREFVAMRRHGLVEVQPLWGPLPSTARVEVASFAGPRFERLAADMNSFCARYAPGQVLPGTALRITGIGASAASPPRKHSVVPFAAVMLAAKTSPRMEAEWLIDERGGWSFRYMSDAGNSDTLRVAHPEDRSQAEAELAFRLGGDAAARSALVALDNTARALVMCLRKAGELLPGIA